MNVTVLGFGGAEIGFESASQFDVDQLLNGALDAGLNVIDTAECYHSSEELIGHAVSHRRSEYYLFTKCGHSSGFDLPDWDTKMLASSIDRSLSRLKTEYVDLVQLHSCSKDILLRGEVIEVLKAAQSAGKTRYIGYSGDGEDALCAIELGIFDSLQTSVNIADQECLTLTLPKAQENGMGVIAKRPVANVAWRTGNVPPANSYLRPYWDRLEVLQYEFIYDQSLKDSVGTAMRFTLSQPGVNVAIVGTKNPSRWIENASMVSQGRLPSSLLHEIRDRWKAVSELDWIGQT